MNLNTTLASCVACAGAAYGLFAPQPALPGAAVPTVQDAAQATEPTSEPAAANLRAEASIRLQSRRFSEAYVRGDTQAQLEIYDDLSSIAPPGQDFIGGAEALKAYWTRPEGQRVLEHVVTPTEIVVGGGLAYDRGVYRGKVATGETVSSFSGKYLVVWKLDQEGVWRMVQDMWNALPEDPATKDER